MTARGVELEPIESFRTPGEYERFVRWLEEQVDAGRLERVPVEEHYYGFTVMHEHWFRVPATGELWRLVEPDPPTYGLFGRVDPRNPARNVGDPQ